MLKIYLELGFIEYQNQNYKNYNFTCMVVGLDWNWFIQLAYESQSLAINN